MNINNFCPASQDLFSWSYNTYVPFYIGNPLSNGTTQYTTRDVHIILQKNLTEKRTTLNIFSSFVRINNINSALQETYLFATYEGAETVGTVSIFVSYEQVPDLIDPTKTTVPLVKGNLQTTGIYKSFNGACATIYFNSDSTRKLELNNQCKN